MKNWPKIFLNYKKLFWNWTSSQDFVEIDQDFSSSISSHVWLFGTVNAKVEDTPLLIYINSLLAFVQMLLLVRLVAEVTYLAPPFLQWEANGTVLF